VRLLVADEVVEHLHLAVALLFAVSSLVAGVGVGVPCLAVVVVVSCRLPAGAADKVAPILVAEALVAEALAVEAVAVAAQAADAQVAAALAVVLAAVAQTAEVVAAVALAAVALVAVEGVGRPFLAAEVLTAQTLVAVALTGVEGLGPPCLAAEALIAEALTGFEGLRALSLAAEALAAEALAAEEGVGEASLAGDLEGAPVAEAVVLEILAARVGGAPPAPSRVEEASLSLSVALTCSGEAAGQSFVDRAGHARDQKGLEGHLLLAGEGRQETPNLALLGQTAPTALVAEVVVPALLLAAEVKEEVVVCVHQGEVMVPALALGPMDLAVLLLQGAGPWVQKSP